MSRRTYNAAGDLASEPDTVCDASFVTTTIMCQIMNVYNAHLVHTIVVEMMQVAQIQLATYHLRRK